MTQGAAAPGFGHRIGRTRIVFRVLAQSADVDQFADLRAHRPDDATAVAPMSELTLLVLRFGFLLLLWVFVFVDRLRAAHRPVRPAGRNGCPPSRAAPARFPTAAAAAAAPAAAPAAAVAAPRAARRRPAATARRLPRRLVITSGPKRGHSSSPLGRRAAHHRPLERIAASSSATTTPRPTTPGSCSGTTSG